MITYRGYQHTKVRGIHVLHILDQRFHPLSIRESLLAKILLGPHIHTVRSCRLFILLQCFPETSHIHDLSSAESIESVNDSLYNS